MANVRIGALGAARITPTALVDPARKVPEASVVAVAARQPERARAFADRRRIPRVLDTYEALISDPEIDAVYVPLPNSLHFEWTMAAIEAGKHVLCEKPFTSNAEEARRVAAAVEGTGLVVMEAFHYRYHPLVERMRAIIDGGELGPIRYLETTLCAPFLKPGDIRFRLDLAGGATMDVGSYTVHMLRTLADAEPEVLHATAKLSSPRVDRWMRADVRFPDGRTGRMTCSLFSANLLSASAKVSGDDGWMKVLNPVRPQVYNRIRVRTTRGVRTEHCERASTYTCQLQAFVDAILRGGPVLTPPSDSVANMAVIDSIYEAAGLGRRGHPEK